jgi:hypothetical protein
VGGREVAEDQEPKPRESCSRKTWASLLTLALLGCVSSRTDSEKSQAKLAQFILDEVPDIQHAVSINFDDKIELLGYEMTPVDGVTPGAKVRLTLFWKVKQKLAEKDWLLFTHILDDRGNRILNVDNVGPLRGSAADPKTQALPPGYWVPGKIYVDRQVFRLPKKISAPTIQIVAGMWRAADRMPIKLGPQLDGNRGLVTTVKVKAAESPAPVPEASVPRVPAGETITIDGNFSEAVWSRAFDTGAFVEVGSGKPRGNAPVGGSAKLLFDDQFFYVGFSVLDQNVLGGFLPTDVDPHLWTRDTVELMIDPDGDGDNKDYYEIQVGPQNLVFDSQFDLYNAPKTEPNGPYGHQEWSAKLVSAVTLRGTIDNSKDEDHGYDIEIRVPWQSFDKAKKRPPADGDTWRMNFYAMQDNGGVAWSPILGQGNFHKAKRFGKVRFGAPPAAPVSSAASPGVSAAPSGVAPSTSATPPAPAPSGAPPTKAMELPRKLQQNPLDLKKAAERLSAPPPPKH